MTITASETITPTGSVRENRTFRRLLRASSVSMLGSHVTTIAYPLLVLRLTGSPFTAGCAVFAATAPSICAYIPAGALVDRWNPRRAMLVSELGRGVAIGIVTLTLALGRPVVGLLMAVAVIEGVLEVFSELAERRYVGSLVDRGRISSALVRTEARTHVAVVAGRPLGGLLFGIDPILPFFFDSLSFVYSVTALVGMRETKPTNGEPAPPRLLVPRSTLVEDIRQGLHWIRDDKIARRTIISFSIGTLIFQALIMVFLGDAHSQDLPALSIGMVLAASGVGGALGSLVASRRIPKISYWMPIQTMIWFAGFSFFLFPAGREFLFTAIIMALLGLTGALGNIALDTHVMQNADKDVLARVTSVGRLASFTACSIGPIIGSILARELGNQRAMSHLFLLALVPLALSILTIVAPGASTRGRHGKARLEAAHDDRSDRLADRQENPGERWDAYRQDDERDMASPVPLVGDGTGADEAERDAVQLKGGVWRLLAGATTIAGLVVIAKRTDR